MLYFKFLVRGLTVKCSQTGKVFRTLQNTIHVHTIKLMNSTG